MLIPSRAVKSAAAALALASVDSGLDAGGSGTLHFKSGRYPLQVGGVSLGPLGAARVDLVGRAYNLQSAANIHGIYSTIPETGRPGTFRLRNWQGVVLELRGRRGAKPPADLSGLQISLR